MKTLLSRIDDAWTLNDGGEKEKRRALKYIIRCMWPQLSDLLDEVALYQMDVDADENLAQLIHQSIEGCFDFRSSRDAIQEQNTPATLRKARLMDGRGETLRGEAGGAGGSWDADGRNFDERPMLTEKQADDMLAFLGELSERK